MASSGRGGRVDNPLATRNTIRDRRHQFELLQVRSEKVRLAELSRQCTMFERHVRSTKRSVSSAQARLGRRFERLLRQSELQRANSAKTADPRLLTERKAFTPAAGEKTMTSGAGGRPLPLMSESSGTFVSTLRCFWNLPPDVRLRAFSDAAIPTSHTSSGIGITQRTSTKLVQHPKDKELAATGIGAQALGLRQEPTGTSFSLPPVEPHQQLLAGKREATMPARSQDSPASRLDSEVERQTESDASTDDIFKRLRELSLHTRPESPLFPRTPPPESARRPAVDERTRRVEGYTRFINGYMSSAHRLNTFKGAHA